MTDEKQKTGAKILNLLQNLTDKVDILSNRMEADLSDVRFRMEKLEEEVQRTKDYADDAASAVQDVKSEVEKIMEQMPDLHEIVLDMQARERNDQRASMKLAF